jgi:hypothetical protein
MTGTYDSLFVDTDLSVQNLILPEIKLHQLNAVISGYFSDRQTILDLKGEVSNAEAFGDDSLKSDFSINYKDSFIDYILQLQQGTDVDADLKGHLLMSDSVYTLNLNDFSIALY